MVSGYGRLLSSYMGILHRVWRPISILALQHTFRPGAWLWSWEPAYQYIVFYIQKGYFKTLTCYCLSLILHCSQSEYVFECGNGIMCEDGRINNRVDQIHLKSRYGHILRHNSKGVKARVGSEAMECWISLIADYTSKHFTYVKDTLPAVSGLTSRMPRDLCGPYLAGLWEHNLGRQLLWKSVRGMH